MISRGNGEIFERGAAMGLTVIGTEVRDRWYHELEEEYRSF